MYSSYGLVRNVAETLILLIMFGKPSQDTPGLKIPAFRLVGFCAMRCHQQRHNSSTASCICIAVRRGYKPY